MDTRSITSAERARHILAAWNLHDFQSLEAELSLAGDPRGYSYEEQERLDLLEGIAHQLKRDSERPEVCLRLLEHLAFGARQSEARSANVVFFPAC